jgi:glycosyltransferase involved in cell wall biosynthesis
MNPPFRFCLAQSGSDATLVRWALGYLHAALRQEGVDAEIVNISSPQGWSACDNADAVIFYRTRDEDALDLFRRLKSQGKFLLYFIDDYIFQPNCKYTTDHRLLPLFFCLADAIVSPNSRLLEKTPRDRDKILRRNVIDQETFDLLNPGQFVRGTPNNLAIGWLAGLGRKEMNSFVHDTLQTLDRKLVGNERATFFCFGSHTLGTFKKVKVVEHPYVAPDKWQELYREYRSFNLGVVINPLDESDEFVHCKSELKLVETGAMMVPLVTSRAHPFTEVIREGKNGFFASTPEEFADKALMVCRNPLLAEKVAMAAQKLVREEYEAIGNTRRFLAEVRGLMARKTEGGNPESKKLIISLDNLGQANGEVVGPVGVGGQMETAILLLPTCEIVGISVLGMIYQKKVKRGLSFQVWKNGVKIYEGGLSPLEMLDNSWWRLPVSPFLIQTGDTLTLRLVNRDLEASLGFYACKDQTIGRARLDAKQCQLIALKLDLKK